MKYLFCLILAIFLVPSVFALEQINSFDSTITINQDTSLTIQEQIDYQTDISKHGIYRYIPFKYQINNLNYSVDVALDKVTDGQNNQLQVKTTYESGNVNWRIGDPDVTFTGAKTYQLKYHLSDVLQQFDTHDELYLDVTGEGWQFPINQSQVTINSPYANIKQATCFVGEFGSSNSDCQINQISESQINIKTQTPISYGQNFTVAIKLETPNQLIFPTQFEKNLKKITDNLWFLLVPLPLIFMFMAWYKHGRDQVFISPNIFDMDKKPYQLRPLFSHIRTPMVYQPLNELTPGEAGAMLDERVDNRDIVSEIIDLARKKYLSITPITTKKLIFTNKDYKFIKLKPADDLLPAHQKYLHQQIFKTKDEVTMASLKGKFHTTMQKVSQMIYQSTTERKYFTKNPVNVMTFYGILVVAVLIGLGLIGVSLNPINPILPIILFGSQLLAVPFFVLGMVQKSAIGSNYFMQAKGLKETIRRGAWREKVHEKNLFFDEVLPFAIAFNVVDKLAKDMKDLNIKPPAYLATTGWTTNSFVSDVNHFGNTASKTLTYNPSSSKAGGSGFSGGSSGGGFGGGGGGSW